MQPHHARRVSDHGGNLVHIQIGRIGRKDRGFWQMGLKRREDLLLDLHAFKRRFNGESGGGCLRIIMGKIDARAAVLGSLIRDQTALQACLDDLFDIDARPRHAFFVCFQQGHTQPCIEQRIGDPCPHCATTHNGHMLKRDGFCNQPIRCFRCAFREKHMPQGTRLIGMAQLEKLFTLRRQPLSHRHLSGLRDQVNRNQWRVYTTHPFERHFARGLNRLGGGGGRGQITDLRTQLNRSQIK